MSVRATVFGGAGFLGSHVADALTDADYEVTVCDLRPSPWLKDGQRMVVGDIQDAAVVADALAGARIVYNFAGIADIDEAAERRLDCIRANVLGNAAILEACCAQGGVERYVFASSLYVYSKAGSFYRSTKQASELIIENYHEQFGIPYTILRYGSLYGPRATGTNAIHAMLQEALHHGMITREGDGDELREYIHIFDAAKFSIDILAPEFSNQHVIITGNQPMKIRDLLNMIRELMNNGIELNFVAPRHSTHYEITPYTFMPRIAKRYVGKTYLDLGQGLLAYLEQMYGELHPLPLASGATGDK